MNNEILKNKIKSRLENFSWRILTTVIITLTAVATIYVYASFIEPAVGPNNAGWDQDFAQNILGNNDANNEFDSSAVTANNDGSIIERLEYIENYLDSR